MTFCSSAQAVAAGEQSLDDGFTKYLQGKRAHRLKEAKTLLNNSEPAVIAEVAKWRKGVHYLHANSLAQAYFLTTEEWPMLQHQHVVMDKTTYSLQSVVAKQTMKTIAEAEIVNTGEVPKLRRGPMTQAIFKELCVSTLQAVKYKAALQTKYAAVWGETGSAEKLFKRLIVVGEPGLRQAFLRGLAVAAGKIENLDFQETDPTSDLAQVCVRLGSAMEALQAQQAQQEQEAQLAQQAQQEQEALQALQAQQAQQEQEAPEDPEDQDAPTQPLSGHQQQEQNAAEQAPAPTAPAQPQEQREAAEKQEAPESQEQREAAEKLAAMDAILRQARIATDDSFLLYDRPWQHGDCVPPGLVDVPAGTLFVAPSPSTSRGLASRAVQALRGPSFGVLELFKDSCAIIIGLGHDPEHKSSVRSHLEQINTNFKKANWELFPVFPEVGLLVVCGILLSRARLCVSCLVAGPNSQMVGPWPVGCGERRAFRRVREALELGSHPPREGRHRGRGDVWIMQGYPEPIRDADAANGKAGAPEAGRPVGRFGRGQRGREWGRGQHGLQSRGRWR